MHRIDVAARVSTLLAVAALAVVARTGGPALTEQQAEILSHMEIVSLDNGFGTHLATLRITGLNVQIVNGLRATNGNPENPQTIDPRFTKTNGLGNLVLGYHEGQGVPRTGSHNLVIGQEHEYTSFGGLIAGRNNHVRAPNSTVAGGIFNAVAGAYSSVAGGRSNDAIGNSATVSGGFLNLAAGGSSSILGGQNNTAQGSRSSISGGVNCQSPGDVSSVSGGHLNKATEVGSSICGGNQNVASGQYSTVNGGDENEAGGHRSTVGGGRQRMAMGLNDWVAGSLFEDD